jgi:hypothetical protein
MGVTPNFQGNQKKTTNSPGLGRWGQKDFAVESQIQREGGSHHHRDFIKETTKLSLQKFVSTFRPCVAPAPGEVGAWKGREED